MLRKLYDALLRPYLPRSEIIVHNGVPARTGKLFDRTKHRTGWESELMPAIRDNTFRGDKVVEIGGGLGICTSEAARRVVPEGHVTTFEMDPERCEIIRDTLQLNRVRDDVDVVSARVESLDQVHDCNLLIMDCEGDEVDLLETLNRERPDRIIVETHPCFDVETESVWQLLERNGYTVENCRSGKGIDVLEARL